ncbi:MAG: hypothetical protein J5934_05510 [Succinivibrio sp.]|nr:hypothetical protein [Succinivibrio sp.]
MKYSLYIFRFLAALATLSGVFVLTSCASDNTTCDVGVYLSPDLQDVYGYTPTLEADIVGLTKVEQKRLVSYDVDKYFAPPQQFRKSLGVVTVRFTDGDTIGKKLPEDSEAWARWEEKGATHLAVIVNLPVVNEVKDNANDPRKLIIDMNGEELMNSSEHFIVIGGSGVIEVKKEPDDGKSVEVNSSGEVVGKK